MQKFRQYYFRQARYSIWKDENFDELQLPWNWIFLVEILHMFPTYQYLQKSTRDLF